MHLYDLDKINWLKFQQDYYSGNIILSHSLLLPAVTCESTLVSSLTCSSSSVASRTCVTHSFIKWIYPCLSLSSFLACAVSLPVLISGHTTFYFHTSFVDNVYVVL